ncbi:MULTISPECIES: FtsQ-type POTRA domain-containing protein [Microbacterium]|uniref:FtsQ-type POTRA domain-containing protein n=1 Tax=Microbacterium TaxID=33882 RepID=UPI00217CCD8F|nr:MULTISPECIES: FtsQ-type POTRA domain-containing protein [Microbacterium]UWF76773.1 FtsQ-type POTRA domain-containing protein [Microbacterium neungamense]WCM54923.1 FtsQ-type POTRA domain-containing protein [Microbacterium sp. EF45047]
MRRPAPLPARPDEPSQEDAEVRAPAPFRKPRRGVSDAAVPTADAADAQALAGAADVQARDGAADAVPDRPLSSADVWRAARARRRALRAEIRRFTLRSRRRRMIWLGSLGAVLLLVLGSVVAAYSPLFAVQKITVAGAQTLDPAAVEAALAEQQGTPLALVDRSAVRAALMTFPLIESYSLEARPPHELLVRIVERVPIGVIESEAGFTLVDAAGVVLSTTPSRPDGAPLLEIDGGTDSAAFRSAGMVVRSLPADVRAALVGVSASSADDVTLTLTDDRSVVWGSAERSAEKAATLDRLIAARPDARTFDVSSPSVGVVGG